MQLSELKQPCTPCAHSSISTHASAECTKPLRQVHSPSTKWGSALDASHAVQAPALSHAAQFPSQARQVPPSDQVPRGQREWQLPSWK